jgi:hypothetical protein
MNRTVFLVLLASVAGGCTRESTRIAIETQQRASQIEQAVFERQAEGLRVLLFRDLLARLGQAGDAPLNAAQRELLSDAWNDRDLAEFWSVQHERARALRLVGVDAMLCGSQSVVDLLLKALNARVERGKQGVAAAAGQTLGDARRDELRDGGSGHE